MVTISDKAALALRGAIASTGKHRGQLKAKCPPSHTLAAAAWQGAMLVCNPFKASVAAVLFMTEEQREIMHEVTASFEAMPKDWLHGSDRDREALEKLGVW